MIPFNQHPARREWAIAQVSGLPFRWQKRLLNKWEKTRFDFNPDELTAEGDATRSAAHFLQEITGKLKTVNIPLDASDADICERAEVLADQCVKLAEVFHEVGSLRAAMGRVCARNHIAVPDGKRVSDAGAVARMSCPQWWRRQLRKLHAKAVEAGAISIGYVNKTRDIYVSNESLERRRQQNRRNREMLENTKAKNELDQEYSLAELAAKSTANKEIRRGELMTRIAGFERIAEECGHVGLFLTMTCPSRMHKWKTVNGGKVIENKNYDRTTPKEAQKHLSKTFARIRSALARRGVHWYGFRIAEPNHDGTPHWHIMVFFDGKWPGITARAALPRVCALVRRYALADSGNERGAKKHRCDFKPMDAKLGTAAGYIAKYVSKNIDGYKVEKDLFGNDAMQSSGRVEAWAATWRIRQFQQVGGAPVGVWRELRRIKELPVGAPDCINDAFHAVNRVEVDGEVQAAAAWDKYIKAQGGVFVGRQYKIKLATEKQTGTGRYGEPLGERPVGVKTLSDVVFKNDGIIPNASVHFIWSIVASVRHVWEISRGSKERREASPWTRVNNCTRHDFADVSKRFESLPELYGPMPKISNFEFFGPLNLPELQKQVMCDAI